MKQLHLKHRLVPDNDNPGSPLHEYVVKKVVDATSPRVDDILNEGEARTYCESENWTVTIT